MEIESHYNLIQTDLIQVRREICEQIMSSHEQSTPVLEVLSEQQGKRMRQEMAMWSGQLFVESGRGCFEL